MSGHNFLIFYYNLVGSTMCVVIDLVLREYQVEGEGKKKRWNENKRRKKVEGEKRK